ncbi:MAG: glycosyltransferase [Kaistella sp.]|nr:glycosyltransferase [Kaistella sp.]
MNNIDISVIVPVYNAEVYLEECLDSICKQSFPEDRYEVILVNDGSADRSGQICDRYAEVYNPSRVIHQKNAGVSAARNAGLANAVGEWIVFVDSDDILDENYLDVLQDITEFDFAMVNVNITERGHTKVFTDYPTEVMDQNSFFRKYKLYPNFAGPWSKFFRREIIEKYNIRFDTSLRFGEDALFNLQYLHHCKQLYVTNKTAYNYRESDTSLSKKEFGYNETKYLLDLVKGELQNYDAEIYLNHILSPLNRTLISLYNDSTFHGERRVGELRDLINSNQLATKNLYRGSFMGYVFLLFTGFKNFKILDSLLQQRLAQKSSLNH